jgi:LuxR family maltose regulon positive regulatory protein
MQGISPGLGHWVRVTLEGPQVPPAEVLLTALLNDLAGSPISFVLVLDHIHVLDAGEVQDALAFLVWSMPAQVHLVVTTRGEPDLPLSQLRARGHLTELRVADLRFTATEAGEFLQRAMGLTLSEAAIRTLETRTEGWIAGLQLAALSLQRRADPAGFIQSFAGDDGYVAGYLVDEVLRRQPAHVREFLLATSVVDRLNGALCDAVTARQDSRALLGELERGNLFLVPLDDKRHWFRYHQLFADMLRAHAQEEQPEAVLVWHRRASDWYARHDLLHDAVRHAFLARDVERAADLVELLAPGMLLGRLDEVLIAWLRALPNEVVRVRPLLSVYYAIAQLSYDLDSAEAHVRNAEAILEDVGDHPDAADGQMMVTGPAGVASLQGRIAIVCAYLAGAAGDVAGIVAHARQALERLPEEDHTWRSGAAALLGMAYWLRGDLAATERTISQSIALMRRTGDVVQSISGAILHANLLVALGRLDAAERALERWIALADEQEDPPPLPTADLYVVYSELCRERNDLDGALGYLDRSRRLGEHAGLAENRHRWNVAMARAGSTG